jgi:dienelactone hydrolase
MSFWLHDETVSLDLLAAHPMVNADALGVVGCSGGGTQSSYLAAMDPRVKAASIACYTSTFEIDRLWAAGGKSDGEQTWPHGIHLGLDKPDLLEVRANLSTQVLVTTADTCFPAAGGIAAVAEARGAYTALGGTLDTFTG